MRRDSGLSLLEVVIATSLLAFVGILVLNLYPTVLIGMHHSHSMDRAERLAQSELNKARLQPFDSLVVGTTTALPPTVWRGNEFNSVLKISAPAQGRPDTLKVLQVIVSWQERGRRRTVSRAVWSSRVRR